MANCKVRSYKAKKGLVRFLIYLRSKFYWHTDYQFSKRHDNISFSSTMQSKPHGCWFRDINYSHPERWTTHVIELTDKQEDMAFNKALELQGKKYDLWGLLSFGTRFKIVKPSKDKLWCTECVCELLNATGKYNIKADQMHPQGLVEYLDERIQ